MESTNDCPQEIKCIIGLLKKVLSHPGRGNDVLYRRQLDLFQFLVDASFLIQEHSSVLTALTN